LGATVSPKTSLWSESTCVITYEKHMTYAYDTPTEICPSVIIDDIIIPNASTDIAGAAK
jgi:hypothetical protein